MKNKSLLRKLRVATILENMENSGKMKLCDMIANKNAFHRIFLSSVAQGKI